MEADMARELFIDNPYFAELNVRLGTLIGDDDSSTIATLRREATHPIKKWSDKNHAVSKLSKCLYAAQLPANLVKYFKYCFGCVLEMNKNDTAATKAGLLNIVPHAFDFHDECGAWCTYKADPANYRHKLLPGGKGLTQENLRQKLQAIFQSFANNGEKLSPCGSSQANESLNRTISSKAPKHLHYGGSTSNDIRVSAAILQKNAGNASIIEITDEMSNRISENSCKYLQKQDDIARKRKIKAKTTQFKKRRRQLSDQSNRKNIKKSAKEGLCYESGCGLDLGTEFIDKSAEPVLVNTNETFQIVYFDLETTGFGKNKEIVEIAAVYKSTVFNVYVMPKNEIAHQASEVTRVQKRNDVLYYCNTPVISLSEIDAMESFLQFLSQIRDKIILTAHNCFSFDSWTLINATQRMGLLKTFKELVVAFADTLPLFKMKLKKDRNPKSSYKQCVLAEEYLGLNASIGAHNAVNDVAVLQQLTEHPDINIHKSDIVQNSRTVDRLLAKKVIDQNTSALKQHLQVSKFMYKNEKEGASSMIIKKMAIAGITLHHLCETYKSSGQKGIIILLAQDIGGTPRITKNKRVISNLCTRINNILSKEN